LSAKEAEAGSVGGDFSKVMVVAVSSILLVAVKSLSGFFFMKAKNENTMGTRRNRFRAIFYAIFESIFTIGANLIVTTLLPHWHS
jgi:hypothetical protein